MRSPSGCGWVAIASLGLPHWLPHPARPRLLGEGLGGHCLAWLASLTPSPYLPCSPSGRGWVAVASLGSSSGSLVLTTCLYRKGDCHAPPRGRPQGSPPPSTLPFRGRVFLSLKASLPPLRVQEANWAMRTQANVPSATGFQSRAPHKW